MLEFSMLDASPGEACASTRQHGLRLTAQHRGGSKELGSQNFRMLRRVTRERFTRRHRMGLGKAFSHHRAYGGHRVRVFSPSNIEVSACSVDSAVKCLLW